MAKLRIEAPDKKTLVVDVGDADPSEYDDLAAAAVEDYTSKNPAPKPGMIDKLFMPPQPASSAEVKDELSYPGRMTGAGYAGMADIVAGNGLKKSIENIEHVKKGEDVTSGAAVMGEALGDQFTPVQIALQAAGGKIGEAVGPWVANAMKGWAADAAVNAVGKIKNIAKALGVNNLDAVGKFLLAPISIGGKSFEPIVTATASPEDMLAAAKLIQSAAGKELQAVSKTVDGVLAGVTDASGMTVNVADAILDPVLLQQSIEELKQEAVGDLPNLGKAVAKQYDDAAKDLALFAKKQADGITNTMFSDLAALKTKIGGLVYKHGSPLESKAALNDVYHAISDALDHAAKSVGGAHGAAYDAANAIYHQVTAVVEALEGRVVDAKKMFDAPAFLTALSTGMSAMGTGHGLLAGPMALAGYGASKVAQKFGPQAIAKGLDVASPLVAEGIKLTARGIPVVSRGIVDALTLKQADEQ